MDTTELEHRWKSITHSGVMPYSSLRISADCIPELYLAVDIKGYRFLILQVPKNITVRCDNVQLQNVSIEWHEDTRFILIGLHTNLFWDLYNDLTLSLYNKIKNIVKADIYTNEFVSIFYKWADFFDPTNSNLLSEFELKGLFWELTMLRWYLTNSFEMQSDDILIAWQGPYGKAHDFIFHSYNLEVKTKNTDEINVHISSEYQLQPQTGKELNLGVVDIQRDTAGMTIDELFNNIKILVIERGADLTVLLKAISKTGLGGINIRNYDNFRWKPLFITLYDANGLEFPKIISTQIQTGISQVKYDLNVKALLPFLTQKIDL